MDNYVGKRLDGRYEIHEIIGVGGMAVVYKAYDNIDQKIVAVKILKDEFLTNEEFKRRFKNESKAIAVLSHPNIVKVLDVSFGDRLQYIVMEYVEGITLKEYIGQQGKVKIREALYFVMQILRALQHAHDKGIVHRDIKPQNIMLISNGTLKVTDFGIATFSRGETKTMSGTAIGSVHYISPEQAKGSLTDAKSDIYSVGVVLYEMLTGALPFESENAVSVALMHLQKEPKRPRELNPEIPIGLEQIIMKAMQKNSADRYQSAAEMLVDLSEFGRNPNVKFDYNFFVDNQPTKFIPSDEIKERLGEEAQSDENDDTDEDAVAAAQKKKTIGILAGVLGGLILFAIIMIVIFVSGSSKKLEVPDFVGLNYAEDILANKDYEAYWEYIETKFIVDSTVDDGTVISQTPKKGKKISTGKTILLEIASNNSKIPVPDVYGKEMTVAQSMIRSEGFLVQVEYDDESTGEEGIVIRTSPEKGELAAQNSTVIIYIPSPTGSGKTVTVPVLAGETLSSAKKILEDLGLVLDVSGSTKRDSDRPAGQIIGNAFAEQEVPKGTKIAVYISTGQQGHVDINIDLPDLGGKKGKLVVTVNGEEQDDAQTVVLDGSAYTVTVGGSGSSNKIKILIDGQKVYSANADFTSDVLSGVETLSNEKTFKYTTTTEKTTESTAKPTEESTSAPSTTASETTQPSTQEEATQNTTDRPTVDHSAEDSTSESANTEG